MKLAEEPIGQSRERFYEMKAALGLAWYCAEKPQVEADGSTTWRFRWNPPEGVNVEPQTLVVGRHNAAFEELCDKLEDKFCQHELGLVCECCALDATDSVCPSCRHSIGFHRCEKRAGGSGAKARSTRVSWMRNGCAWPKTVSPLHSARKRKHCAGALQLASRAP